MPEKYREKYEELKKFDLLPGKACSMKENNWYSCVMHSTIDAMKDIARMMRVRLEKIMNYLVHRITDARAEGINSKIRLIEKMAYGFRNKGHLKYMAVFRCANLQLYP